MPKVGQCHGGRESRGALNARGRTITPRKGIDLHFQCLNNVKKYKSKVKFFHLAFCRL